MTTFQGAARHLASGQTVLPISRVPVERRMKKANRK